LGNVDLSTIAFTGHSRGGKTALLAGVLDERATIVNPNEACAGGCSNYRLVINAITEDGEEKPSEPISNIFHHFPAWMGKDLKEYIGREADSSNLANGSRETASSNRELFPENRAETHAKKRKEN
jgi:hypothetical protein